MIRLKKILFENLQMYRWREHTKDDMHKAVVSLFSRENDYEKTLQALNVAPVKRIPYSYFKFNGFEPFTKEDLKGNTYPGAKKIAQGFLRGQIPYLFAVKKKNGKIEVLDGFTRAAVAIALKIPILAKVVDLNKISG